MKLSRHPTTVMKNESYDVGRIEDVAKLHP